MGSAFGYEYLERLYPLLTTINIVLFELSRRKGTRNYRTRERSNSERSAEKTSDETVSRKSSF